MEWIRIAEFAWKIYNALTFKKGITAKKNPLAWRDLVKINTLSKHMVLDGYSIDFIFVILLHNGKRNYFSIVGGYVEDILMKKFKIYNYENVTIDKDYERLFQIAETDGETETLLADLGKGSLREQFEYEKIKYCRSYFIKKAEKSKFKCIIQIGTTQADEYLNLNYQNHAISIFLNKVNIILNEY